MPTDYKKEWMKKSSLDYFTFFYTTLFTIIAGPSFELKQTILIRCSIYYV